MEARDNSDAGEPEVVVQMAGIIDDEPEANDASSSASVGTSSTPPGNDRPAAGPDSVLEPSPGYKPTPPTAIIIAQLDNVSDYWIFMFFATTD